jgi:ppGpp synthetase/RelA/SpoT-type nucleotidyltranferase
MSLIDEFVARYPRELDYYDQLARLCQQQCEIALEQSGIRAIVTSRAKRPDRLKPKLEKRQVERGSPYASLDDIASDIYDLAGVRIALYFPGNREEVEKIILDRFSVHKTKSFPDGSATPDRTKHPNRFSGYHASHYRLHLREESLKPADIRFGQGAIEVQVASVLMHAWSEVNHDMVYKPLSGDLSFAELAMLDQLNGLVLSGEIALESLQRAARDRIGSRPNPSMPPSKFSNHFELASFLHNHAKVNNPSVGEPIMGRVDILFDFLEEANLNNPTDIQELQNDYYVTEQGLPLANQYLDTILSENPNLYPSLAKVEQKSRHKNPYGSPQDEEQERRLKSMGQFIRNWGALESLLHSLLPATDAGGRAIRWSFEKSLENAKNMNLINKEDIEPFKQLQKFRSQVVHSDKQVDADDLDYANHHIESYVHQMLEKAPKDGPVRQEIVKAQLRIMGESASSN